MASTLLSALGLSTGNLDPTTLSALARSISGLGQTAGVNAQQAGTNEMNTMTDLGLQNSSMAPQNVAWAEESAALGPQQLQAQDLLSLLGVENQANALNASQQSQLAQLGGEAAALGGGSQNTSQGANDPNAFNVG